MGVNSAYDRFFGASTGTHEVKLVGNLTSEHDDGDDKHLHFFVESD